MSTKYHCDGILPCFIWPDDVRHAATEVQVLADAVNAQAKTCTSLDSSTRDGWAEFYAGLTAVMSEDKGAWFGLGGVMDEIAGWADDLYGWQQRLASQGCSGGPPVTDPNAIREGERWTMKLAQWGLYAVIVAAGAYAVGEVISIIPKPAPPPRERLEERRPRRRAA
jgi:hypothetical protein